MISEEIARRIQCRFLMLALAGELRQQGGFRFAESADLRTENVQVLLEVQNGGQPVLPFSLRMLLLHHSVMPGEPPLPVKGPFLVEVGPDFISQRPAFWNGQPVMDSCNSHQVLAHGLVDNLAYQAGPGARGWRTGSAHWVPVLKL